MTTDRPHTHPEGSGSESDGQLGVHRLHLWQIQAVRDVLVIAAAVGVLWVGYALRAVTVPLLVALLLAYLFEPVIRHLTTGTRLNRHVVTSGLLCSLVLAVVFLLAVIVPLVVGQSVRLLNDLREGRWRQTMITVRGVVPEVYRDDLDSAVQFFGGAGSQIQAEEREAVGNTDDRAADASQTIEPAWAQSVDHGPVSEQELREIVRDELEAIQGGDLSVPAAVASPGPDEFRSWARILTSSAAAVVGFLGELVRVGFLLFLIPFYFFFFSLWYPKMLAFGESLIPIRNKARTVELLGKMDRAVAGFVRGRVVISLIMGVLLAIGWSACGVNYAIVLGLVTGVFCIVPYLGGVGVPLAVGLLLLEHLSLPPDERAMWLGTLGVFLWPTLVFVIVQVIEGYVLVPAIAGKATNLDPVTIVVVVLAGGSVLGVYGMLLAIPIAACGKILLTEVCFPRIRAWAQARAADPLPISRE